MYSQATVPQLNTHSVALATIRDATVAFGVEYGALLVPVERRIVQYLRQQRLLVVGGHTSDGSVSRSSYSFDAVAGVWVEEAPMTEGRYQFGLCVLRGNLLAVGGLDKDHDPLRSCELFDVATHTWAREPFDMATKRMNFGVGVLNEEVWVIGGKVSDIDSDMDIELSSCERVDAVTGTWVPGPDMTMPREGQGVAVIRGELWVVGADGLTERVDPANNRWVRGPDHTLERNSFVVAVFRDQLWVVGGTRDEGDEVLSSCHFLDVASNTWKAGPPMTIPRYWHSLAVLDGELWAVGGRNLSGYLQSCERLDAATNVWVAGPDLPMPSIEHCCAVI